MGMASEVGLQGLFLMVAICFGLQVYREPKKDLLVALFSGTHASPWNPVWHPGGDSLYTLLRCAYSFHLHILYWIFSFVGGVQFF